MRKTHLFRSDSSMRGQERRCCGTKEGKEICDAHAEGIVSFE